MLIYYEYNYTIDEIIIFVIKSRSYEPWKNPGR